MAKYFRSALLNGPTHDKICYYGVQPGSNMVTNQLGKEKSLYAASVHRMMLERAHTNRQNVKTHITLVVAPTTTSWYLRRSRRSDKAAQCRRSPFS